MAASGEVYVGERSESIIGEFLRVISPDSLSYKTLGLLFCLRTDPFRCLVPVRASVVGVCPLRRSCSWKKAANERLVRIRAFQLTNSNANSLCERRWARVRRVGRWVDWFRNVWNGRRRANKTSLTACGAGSTLRVSSSAVALGADERPGAICGGGVEDPPGESPHVCGGALRCLDKSGQLGPVGSWSLFFTSALQLGAVSEPAQSRAADGAFGSWRCDEH